MDKVAQMQMLSINSDLVNCKCGNIMEVVQGDVQRNLKDE